MNLFNNKKTEQPSPQKEKLVPEYLFLVFRNKEVVGDRKAFANIVARTLFPEYLGKGLTLIILDVDPNMPIHIDGAKPNSYPYAMMCLIMIMEQFGMGKLDLGKRHNLAWSNYDDAQGGRGIIFVVFPWKE